MRKHEYISRPGSEPWGSQQMPARSDRGPQEDAMHPQTSLLQGPSTSLTANTPPRPKASPPRLAGTDRTQGDSSWQWLEGTKWGKGAEGRWPQAVGWGFCRVCGWVWVVTTGHRAACLCSAPRECPHPLAHPQDEEQICLDIGRVSLFSTLVGARETLPWLPSRTLASPGLVLRREQPAPARSTPRVLP